MRFVLPTSCLDLACAVPNFTGIPAVTAQPASSVYYDVVRWNYIFVQVKSDLVTSHNAYNVKRSHDH